MSISISSSATNLIGHALQRTNNAAQEIAELPLQKNEVGSSEYNAHDLIKPVISLKTAEFETSAATKLINADNKAIGSIIDLKA